VPKPQLVDIDYEEFLHETPKGGKLFLIDGKEVWLQGSLIEVDIDAKTITLPRRIAYNKGLI